MNFTTIEQSKHLLDLGLKPETCDKVWVLDRGAEVEFTIDLMDEDDYDTYVYTHPNDMYVPCWSTGALLELMPTIHKFEEDYLPILSKYQEFWDGKKEDKWSCAYQTEYSSGCIGEIISFISDTQIESAYNMIIWLLENNYI